MRLLLVATSLLLACGNAAGHELTVSGTRFLLDGAPFPYTGVSFFNAIYNREFNRDSAARIEWLRKFRRYGINVLRIWSQWDSRRGYMDTCPQCTLYHPDGQLRTEHLQVLKAILTDADREGFVIELVLFSQESWHDNIRLGPEEAQRAVATLTRELAPWRNVTFQVWNEFSERVPEHVKEIRAADRKRLVTNSPGVAGDLLGDPAQPRLLDYLTPHTSRPGNGKTWNLAAAEIRYLVERYGKPVVDDEPGRNGTASFGGPKEPTHPYDHIVHIWEVWKAGGYTTYHHDMVQTGQGSRAVPAHGVPDPEFSPYHRVVFEFLAHRERHQPVR